MISEIGSNFWIDPSITYDSQKKITPEVFGCIGNDFAWLSTGRSAISLVIETIEQRNPEIKKIALIPSYTCHTVIEPFLQAGYGLKTIPVDKNLCTQGVDLLKAVKEVDASIVLLHRYFGFETLPNCFDEIRELRKIGVKVIEDRTQCLYSDFQPLNVDYIVGSIRKWLGVPDGGFAVCSEGKFMGKPSKQDLTLEQAKISASIMKYNFIFMHEGEKKSFIEKFHCAEDILDNQNEKYSIGDFSMKMQANLDVEKLKSQRRQNYSFLLNHIGRTNELHPVFSQLPRGVTPLYFPVLIKDRKAVQKHLANSLIFAPIVWPKAECLPTVCDEANEFYDEMLCLPIDQRYDHNDMNRIIDCLSHK